MGFRRPAAEKNNNNNNINNYLLTESEVFTGKSRTETGSRLISCLLYGFLFGFCKPVIGPWALQKNNDLVLANQSTR